MIQILHDGISFALDVTHQILKHQHMMEDLSPFHDRFQVKPNMELCRDICISLQEKGFRNQDQQAWGQDQRAGRRDQQAWNREQAGSRDQQVWNREQAGSRDQQGWSRGQQVANSQVSLAG